MFTSILARLRGTSTCITFSFVFYSYLSKDSKEIKKTKRTKGVVIIKKRQKQEYYYYTTTATTKTVITTHAKIENGIDEVGATQTKGDAACERQG